jgi:hypothetical protein
VHVLLYTLTHTAHDVAAPAAELALAAPTPEAVLEQDAYVYLFLVVVAPAYPEVDPIAKMPRVLFPAAAPLFKFATLAAPTPQAVLVQDA